jgi:hypothetical protein
MVGWRGSRVRYPAFGDQPSRANSIQSLMLNRCNVVISLGNRWCVLAPQGTCFGGVWARGAAAGYLESDNSVGNGSGGKRSSIGEQAARRAGRLQCPLCRKRRTSPSLHQRFLFEERDFVSTPALPIGASRAGPVVAADAPLASVNDSPATPKIGRLSGLRFRFGDCFARNMAKVLLRTIARIAPC